MAAGGETRKQTVDLGAVSPEATAKFARSRNLPGQLMRKSPFGGSMRSARVGLLRRFLARPTSPLSHPPNFRRPLAILETCFHGADAGPDHWRLPNRYIEVLGLAPVLVTCDPAVNRAISMATGDKPGQPDRDTLPTDGISHAYGTLFAVDPASGRLRTGSAINDANGVPPFDPTSGLNLLADCTIAFSSLSTHNTICRVTLETRASPSSPGSARGQRLVSGASRARPASPAAPATPPPRTVDRSGDPTVNAGNVGGTSCGKTSWRVKSKSRISARVYLWRCH